MSISASSVNSSSCVSRVQLDNQKEIVTQKHWSPSLGVKKPPPLIQEKSHNWDTLIPFLAILDSTALFYINN